MFSHVFCHRMKLIRDAIRLPLEWPYDAVIMGLWLVLLSEKPSSTSRVVGQQTAKTIFKLFNVQSYIIFGLGGRWGIKNYQETKRGAELILLLRTGGGGHDIINFPFEAHFSVPLLIIIAYSLSLYLCCRSRMTDRNACLTTIFHPVPIILCSHNQRLRKKRH